MPEAGRAARRFSVHEGDRFVGCVVYGCGGINLAQQYGLKNTECLELVRVALDRHDTPTSRIVAVSVRLLRRSLPGLRLLASYADSGQGHHGGIYQAGGWTYVGPGKHRQFVKVDGTVIHPRTAYGLWGTSSVPGLRAMGHDVEAVSMPPKHKYLLPLTEDMRVMCERLRRPYPKKHASVV